MLGSVEGVSCYVVACGLGRLPRADPARASPARPAPPRPQRAPTGRQPRPGLDLKPPTVVEPAYPSAYDWPARPPHHTLGLKLAHPVCPKLCPQGWGRALRSVASGAACKGWRGGCMRWPGRRCALRHAARLSGWCCDVGRHIESRAATGRRRTILAWRGATTSRLTTAAVPVAVGSANPQPLSASPATRKPARRSTSQQLPSSRSPSTQGPLQPPQL